tara:strand:- start:212 stop:1372 length:1161 start_codon:yes stop_codon:yes gene_type:complete
MKAVILAAGKATRIRPFSLTRPKGLIPLGNVPLLSHTFNALASLSVSVTEIVLVVGYMADQLKSYFGDSFAGIKVSYVSQEEQLGTGHAVLCAKGFISEDEKFFVINGDDLYSAVDLEKLVSYDNVMLLQELEDVSAFGVVTVDSSGKVVSLIEKPSGKVPSNYVNTGAFVFTGSLFSILSGLSKSERGEYELTDAVKELASSGLMHAAFVEHYWTPVGYPWHILSASKTVLVNRDIDSLLFLGTVDSGALVEGEVSIDAGSTVGKGSRLTGAIAIGKNVKIGENCTISGNVCILDDCIVGDGAIISDSVMFSYATVESGAFVHDSVLGEDSLVEKGVRLKNIGHSGTVKVLVKGSLKDSGHEELGAFVADKAVVSSDTKPGDFVE